MAVLHKKLICFLGLSVTVAALAWINCKKKHKADFKNEEDSKPRYIASMRDIENHFEQEVKHEDKEKEAVIVKLKDYSWLKSHQYELISAFIVLMVIITIVIAAALGSARFDTTEAAKKSYNDSLENAKYLKMEMKASDISNRIDSLDRHASENSDKVIKAVKGQKRNKK